jgi:hypothetical protein
MASAMVENRKYDSLPQRRTCSFVPEHIGAQDSLSLTRAPHRARYCTDCRVGTARSCAPCPPGSAVVGTLRFAHPTTLHGAGRKTQRSDCGDHPASQVLRSPRRREIGCNRFLPTRCPRRCWRGSARMLTKAVREGIPDASGPNSPWGASWGPREPPRTGTLERPDANNNRAQARHVPCTARLRQSAATELRPERMHRRHDLL